MAKVKINRQKAKKGILTEVEIPGVMFDGMEPGDVAVVYIKTLSYSFVEAMQNRIKDADRDNLLNVLNDAVAEVLVDENGEQIFESGAEIPFTFMVAAQDKILHKAFDLKFQTGGTEEDTKEKLESIQAGEVQADSNTLPYGPNGADNSPSSGDLSANPFTQTLEGDSSTG